MVGNESIEKLFKSIRSQKENGAVFPDPVFGNYLVEPELERLLVESKKKMREICDDCGERNKTRNAEFDKKMNNIFLEIVHNQVGEMYDDRFVEKFGFKLYNKKTLIKKVRHIIDWSFSVSTIEEFHERIQSFGIIMFDLTGLKSFNSNCGYEAGDLFLLIAAVVFSCGRGERKNVVELENFSSKAGEYCLKNCIDVSAFAHKEGDEFMVLATRKGKVVDNPTLEAIKYLMVEDLLRIETNNMFPFHKSETREKFEALGAKIPDTFVLTRRMEDAYRFPLTTGYGTTTFLEALNRFISIHDSMIEKGIKNGVTGNALEFYKNFLNKIIGIFFYTAEFRCTLQKQEHFRSLEKGDRYKRFFHFVLSRNEDESRLRSEKEKLRLEKERLELEKDLLCDVLFAQARGRFDKNLFRRINSVLKNTDKATKEILEQVMVVN